LQKSRIAIWFPIALLILFAFATAGVVYENSALFRLINSHNNPATDQVFGLISGLGDGLVAVLLAMIVTLYRTRLGCSAVVAFLLSGLITQLLKRLFDLPRPPAVLEHVHLLGAPLQSHSFPSGHATTDGVMATAAILLWGNKQHWIAGGIASLFMLAAVGRIYGGVHFPQDVWVGFIIGIITMLACWKWSLRWPIAHWQHYRWWLPMVGLLLTTLACVLGLGYRVHPSSAQPLALMVPIIALFLLAKQWKASP